MQSNLFETGQQSIGPSPAAEKKLQNYLKFRFILFLKITQKSNQITDGNVVEKLFGE
jgi:hypothetical protein